MLNKYFYFHLQRKTEDSHHGKKNKKKWTLKYGKDQEGHL